MSDTQELVVKIREWNERERERARACNFHEWVYGPLLEVAAARLEAQDALLTEALEALEPFAELRRLLLSYDLMRAGVADEGFDRAAAVAERLRKASKNGE